MSVIFHCVRFRVAESFIINSITAMEQVVLVNKSYDQNVLFSEIIVYHLRVYILGYPCLDQSMIPRLRFQSVSRTAMVADTYSWILLTFHWVIAH
jgi:hypothetical protein